MSDRAHWFSYSEQSARSALARARKRGDFDTRMFFCTVCDTWHVERANTEKEDA